VFKFILIFLALILALTLLACNPAYITRAAYEEAKILLNRQDINEAIKDPNIDPKIKHKLELVLATREFAKAKGMQVGESYTKYTDIGKEHLAWIVMAALPDKFQLKTWWFPIVGSFPYKGFFHEIEARDYAKELEASGYETWVRPTDAFSTLGWFNDPILSTTLKRTEASVVNTVLHELFHSTVWAKNQVIFNESAANYYAHIATLSFYEHIKKDCISNYCFDQATSIKESIEANKNWQVEQELAEIIDQLYLALNNLYQSDLPKEQKLIERKAIFEKSISAFKEKYPKAKILQTINNAEIMQLRTYLTGFDPLSEIAKKCSNQLECMLKELELLSKDSAMINSGWEIVKDK
jgi:predicted aminopeptidase